MGPSSLLEKSVFETRGLGDTTHKFNDHLNGTVREIDHGDGLLKTHNETLITSQGNIIAPSSAHVSFLHITTVLCRCVSPAAIACAVGDRLPLCRSSSQLPYRGV